jgi:hypothetical protein
MKRKRGLKCKRKRGCLLCIFLSIAVTSICREPSPSPSPESRIRSWSPDQQIKERDGTNKISVKRVPKGLEIKDWQKQKRKKMRQRDKELKTPILTRESERGDDDDAVRVSPQHDYWISPQKSAVLPSSLSARYAIKKGSPLVNCCIL